jgi:hypothetical protein
MATSCIIYPLVSTVVNLKLNLKDTQVLHTIRRGKKVMNMKLTVLYSLKQLNCKMSKSIVLHKKIVVQSPLVINVQVFVGVTIFFCAGNN